METHEFADIFPMMDKKSFNNLKKDIKENGYLEDQPIVIFENKILDGRNRFKACEELKIIPKQIQYTGTTPLQYVISTNLNRRHLNDGQRSMVAAEIANLPHGGIEYSNSEVPSGTSITEAASKMNVSVRSVKRAKKIKKSNPKKAEEVKDGNKKLGTAESEIKKEEQEKRIEETIPQKGITGTYDVVVIDPPWNYGRKYDPDSSRIASPYPEMNYYKLKEINIPIEDDGILFLWTTHQFIWEAKQLMNDWGFDYKAILVWNKEKMGMGSWLRMQCEFCLIGIKGKPLWKAKDIRDIITQPRTKHSVKPEIFYKMVDEICAGRKLDYFARKQREGWDVYGNEV